MSIASLFANPSAWGIGLAIISGIIWLAPLVPLKLNRPSTWGVFFGGVIFFAPAIVWVQVPMQYLADNLMMHWLGTNTFVEQISFTAIPALLLSGLAQEGAKLIPPVIYWWRQGKNISPKLGLSLGAMAGAGFGIMQAQWGNNIMFAYGWNLGLLLSTGLIVEQFFPVGFHIAAGAVMGWGLAMGCGWQFYLIGSFTHTFYDYIFSVLYSDASPVRAIMLQNGKLTIIDVEALIAVWAIIVFGAAV